MHSLNKTLLALLMPLLLCAGCGAPVTRQVGGAVSALNPGCSSTENSKPISAAGPATLRSISPAVVQAGSDTTAVTLCATGIGTGAVIHMDGVVHTAALVSSTAATVTLTRSELVAGGRHTFSIQNGGFADSSVQTLLITAGSWAFGDSITYGYGLPDPASGNYAHLLASSYALHLVNSARSGDQACDLWQQLFTSAAGYGDAAAPLYSVMIGTNDVDKKGIGAYQAVFRLCDLAALSWLGTPRRGKVLAGDAAMVAGGGCTGIAAPSAYGGILCAGSSGSVTVQTETSGNPVYVWYLLSDSAGPSDGITVTLDGAAAGTFPTRTTLSIATQNGGTTACGVVRLPARAGSHSLQISTVGTAGVLGVGSNPSVGADRPRLLVGDLPNQAYGTPVASVADQLTYNADILAVEDMLLADGIEVHRALTRSYMLGTVFEMADQLHPNAVGQQELGIAFATALP